MPLSGSSSYYPIQTILTHCTPLKSNIATINILITFNGMISIPCIYWSIQRQFSSPPTSAPYHTIHPWSISQAPISKVIIFSSSASSGRVIIHKKASCFRKSVASVGRTHNNLWGTVIFTAGISIREETHMLEIPLIFQQFLNFIFPYDSQTYLFINFISFKVIRRGCSSPFLK